MRFNRKTQKITLVVLVLLTIALCANQSFSKDIDRSKKSGNSLQRTATDLNDLQQNTVSKVQFFTTNYGIFGLNVAGNVGGGYWPRNSGNQYIFGGGIWFGAVKLVGSEPRAGSVISYNPNSGNSWMTPGVIEEGDLTEDNPDNVAKYRAYFSTDMKPDGTPRIATDGPNWPIWDLTSKLDTIPTNATNKQLSRYFGSYVNDITRRSPEFTEQWDDGTRKGPVFISGEDIFCVYKDTDLRRSELGVDVAKSFGYPYKLQVEQTIYSWGFGEYANFIFLSYKIINKSSDTLRECWMAPAYDFDLAVAGNTQSGAGNDRVDYYEADTTLNLAFQWTQVTSGEGGRNFGYLGMDFLESPAVDGAGFIRKDKRYYENNEQLGLRTFRNWVIANDPNNDVARYDFMAAGIRERDNGAGDKRFLMATGPFNMLPGDSARVVVGVVFAPTGKGAEADGTEEDLTSLIRRDKFAQQVYDNAFATPKPPEVSSVTWEPINNGVVVKWDDAAQRSIDRQERGLDFLGYTVYRARSTALDTFDINSIAGNAEYSLGKGPFGWKQVANFVCPKPYVSSAVRSDVTNSRSSTFPNVVFTSINTSSRTYNVRRIPNAGVEPWSNFWVNLANNNRALFDALTLGKIVVRPGTLNTLPTISNNAADTARAIALLYQYVREDRAILEWNTIDAENRDDFRAVVNKYVDSISNNRKFVDVGDDNRDGVITEDIDLSKTERLINNVDYFYRVLAFDEGDYYQATSEKLNSGVEKVNVVQTFPLKGTLRTDASVSDITYDASKVGGLYNFRLLVKDQARFNQLYGGKELELEFTPLWLGSQAYPIMDSLVNSNVATPKALVTRQMSVKDKVTGEVLAKYDVDFEPIDCNGSGLFSEYSIFYLSPFGAGYDSLRTTIDSTFNFANPNNTEIRQRSGTFTTNKVCNGNQQFINQTLGLAFDYSMQQFGGVYRGQSQTISKSDGANVLLSRIPDVERLQVNRAAARFETYNNGPADYEVEFLPGGVEQVNTSSTNGGTKTYNVPFLNVRLRNVKTYKRANPAGGDSIVVGYPYDYSHNTQSLPVTLPDGSSQVFPSSTLVPLDNFNLSSYGWVNGRSSDANTQRSRQAMQGNTGSPVVQGKYYLSTIDQGDTLDFVHTISVGGVDFILDYSGKRGRKGGVGSTWTFYSKDPLPTKDFSAGDKVTLSTFGSVLGMPAPGAKVNIKISPSVIDTTANTITDTDLEKVLVVPNPYIISHLGQRSTYDAKIYFTNLPAVCTIKIYTLNGDLIRTISHKNEDGTDKQGMNVWDLLSDNNQRASSQGLFAVIETPNGAKTIKKFSVVVGGNRVVGR